MADRRPSLYKFRWSGVYLSGKHQPRSMTTTARISIAIIFALGLVVSGCSKKGPTPLDRSPASNQLKHFIAEKKAQATAAAAKEGQEMLPEFKSIFAAAERGDWETISNTFDDLRRVAALYPDKDGT